MVVLEDIEKLDELYASLDSPFKSNYNKARISLDGSNVVFLNGPNYIVVSMGDFPVLKKIFDYVGIPETTACKRREKRKDILYLQKDDLPEETLMVLDSMNLEK